MPDSHRPLGDLRGLAAFDFDGTLTERDTLVPFLAANGRRLAFTRALATAATGVRRRTGEVRDHLKIEVIRSLFAGVDHERLEAEGAAYAEQLPSGYRPEALAHLQHHRERGHELTLVTASLGCYARPAATALGFDHVIAVELETDDHGRCTGEVIGRANVRGAEKARRLTALIGDVPTEVWAYGNSSGDDELLAMADHPTWIGRRNR